MRAGYSAVRQVYNRVGQKVGLQENVCVLYEFQSGRVRGATNATCVVLLRPPRLQEGSMLFTTTVVER